MAAASYQLEVANVVLETQDATTAVSNRQVVYVDVKWRAATFRTTGQTRLFNPLGRSDAPMTFESDKGILTNKGPLGGEQDGLVISLRQCDTFGDKDRTRVKVLLDDLPLYFGVARSYRAGPFLLRLKPINFGGPLPDHQAHRGASDDPEAVIDVRYFLRGNIQDPPASTIALLDALAAGRHGGGGAGEGPEGTATRNRRQPPQEAAVCGDGTPAVMGQRPTQFDPHAGRPLSGAKASALNSDATAANQPTMTTTATSDGGAPPPSPPPAPVIPTARDLAAPAVLGSPEVTAAPTSRAADARSEEPAKPQIGSQQPTVSVDATQFVPTGVQGTLPPGQGAAYVQPSWAPPSSSNPPSSNNARAIPQSDGDPHTARLATDRPDAYGSDRHRGPTIASGGAPEESYEERLAAAAARDDESGGGGHGGDDWEASSEGDLFIERNEQPLGFLSWRGTIPRRNMRRPDVYQRPPRLCKVLDPAFGRGGGSALAAPISFHSFAGAANQLASVFGAVVSAVREGASDVDWKVDSAALTRDFPHCTDPLVAKYKPHMCNGHGVPVEGALYLTTNAMLFLGPMMRYQVEWQNVLFLRRKVCLGEDAIQVFGAGNVAFQLQGFDGIVSRLGTAVGVRRFSKFLEAFYLMLDLCLLKRRE